MRSIKSVCLAGMSAIFGAAILAAPLPAAAAEHNWKMQHLSL